MILILQMVEKLLIPAEGMCIIQSSIDCRKRAGFRCGGQLIIVRLMQYIVFEYIRIFLMILENTLK